QDQSRAAGPEIGAAHGAIGPVAWLDGTVREGLGESVVVDAREALGLYGRRAAKRGRGGRIGAARLGHGRAHRGRDILAQRVEQVWIITGKDEGRKPVFQRETGEF